MPTSQIEPKLVPKVWGSTHLEPWFSNSTEQIGEVWFPAGDLLIKFLFTSENLSVQVHPDDDYAAKHENSRGKTEMWHILRSEPGAKVALGFKNPIDASDFRRLSETGELMDHLAWHDASPGDTFFTPAGTVHAIGAGLALCEIQQNSDVTYRIFDYGRPRELHLDRAIDVSQLVGHEGAATPKPGPNGSQVLVESEHFLTEKFQAKDRLAITRPGYAVILDGHGTIDGKAYQAGTVWELGQAGVVIDPTSETTLLLTGTR